VFLNIDGVYRAGGHAVAAARTSADAYLCSRNSADGLFERNCTLFALFFACATGDAFCREASARNIYRESKT
jgi:hypothetical protein